MEEKVRRIKYKPNTDKQDFSFHNILAVDLLEIFVEFYLIVVCVSLI
jgi:hypothetical protein